MARQVDKNSFLLFRGVGYTQPVDLGVVLEGGDVGRELSLVLVLQPLVRQLVADQAGRLSLVGILLLPDGRHPGLVDHRATIYIYK